MVNSNNVIKCILKRIKERIYVIPWICLPVTYVAIFGSVFDNLPEVILGSCNAYLLNIYNNDHLTVS
jgi:hypothetical protein